jgi:SAM-dependent methyltransferase
MDRRGNPLETVLCQTCGLVSHGSIPSDEELSEYYERQYRQDYHGEFTPSPYRVLREWKRGEQLVKLLGHHLPPAARVLEIGSGIGCTIKNFELAGFQARGIEPGQGFCTFSRQQMNAPVTPFSLDQLPGTEDQDLVLLVHVLEHLNNPSAALRKLREFMSEKGLCYIEVPNFSGPHAAPGRQFHVAHIYNFTPSTLSMLAEANGMVIRKLISAPTDKNLQILLARGPLPADGETTPVDPESFSNSTRALLRYSSLGYHLRWRYLRDRVGTLLRHGGNRWRASARLEELLQRCQAQKPNPGSARQAA